MTHVYLTESVIKDALKARSITEREANELIRTLKRCKTKRSHAPRQRVAS